MAEINNFEDIQHSFEQINETLDSMRSQNVLNTGTVDKVLSNINLRLEGLANDENTDLIKVFLAELKRSLEERHNFVSSKFGQIEDSFNNLLQASQSQIQASEIKAVFDIIAGNLNTFANEFTSQRDIISQISLQIDEFHKDDSHKKEILRNISVLKVELEKVGNGFESIIINLNNNFSQLSETLNKLDSSEFLEGLKKDIENVFLSSSAVLSTLQVIDRKNRELEDVLTQVVTKQDFKLEQDQVAKLIVQNTEITEFLNTLPTQNNMADLTEKIDTSVGVITALKNMLTETGKQNQEMLTAQLESLESKILNISSEEEFIGFRKELSQFAKEVMQSTDIMRSDLASTNEELKSITEFLNDINIKDKFDSFANLSMLSENNIKDRITILSDDITKEIEKNNGLTKKDIKDGVLKVNEKIDTAKEELAEGSKLNLSSILENIQGVISNIFSAKNALQMEGQENTQTITAKMDEVKEDLKEDFTLSNNFMAQNAHENLKTILSSFENVLEEITVLKNNLNEASSTQVLNLTATFNETSKKIEGIKEDLNQNSQENFANLLTIVEDFSQTIAALKNSLEQIALDNAQETKNFLETVSQKITQVQNSLSTDAEANFSEVKSTLSELTNMVPSVRASLEQSANARFSTLNSGVETLLNEVRALQENSEVANQTGLSKILSVIEDFSNEFMNHKEASSESAKSNIETISLYIQNLNRKIEDTKADLNDSMSSSFTDMRNLLSTLPAVIRGNQSVFEDEKKALLEENAVKIEELGEKIEELLNGFMSRPNPFNEEIINEFAKINAAVDKVKERLNLTRSIIEENVQNNINENIRNLEEQILQFSENYNNSVLSLQSKLVEYFDATHNWTIENDLKLDSSLKDTGEIRAEIQSIVENLETMKQDTSVAQLSNEMGRKFEGILLNITQMEAAFTNKSFDSVQNVLSVLEEKFEEVSSDLRNYKEASTEEINDFLLNLEEKVDAVKGHLSLANTDIINALQLKSEEMVLWLTPIRDAVSRVAEINLEEIIHDIKNQIDSSYYAINTVINETVKKENSSQLEEIAQEFEGLRDKLEEILAVVASHTKDEFSQLKEVLDTLGESVANVAESVIPQTLSENYIDIKNLVTDIKTQNATLINDVLKSVLNRLDEMYLPAETTEKIVSDAKTEIIEKLDDIQDRILEVSEENSQTAKSQIIAKIEEIEDNIRNSQEENFSLSKAEILDSILDLQKGLKENMTFAKADLLEKLEAVSEELIIAHSQNSTANKAEIIERIQIIQDRLNEPQGEDISALKAEFIEKLDDIQDRILEFSEDSSQMAKSQIIGKIEEVEDNLRNSQEESFSYTRAEILDSLSDIRKAIEEDQRENTAVAKVEILDKITQSHEETKTSLIELLKENVDSIKENLAQINVEEQLGDTLSSELLKLEKAFDLVCEKVEDKLEQSEDNYTNTTQELLSEIKSSFFEKVEDGIDDLKSFIEVIEEKKDILTDLDEIKTEIVSRFADIEESLSETIKKANVKDDVDDLSKQVQILMDDLFQNLEEKFASLLKTDENIMTLGEKIEDLKGEISSDIVEKLSRFESNFENQKKEFTDMLDEVKNALNELKESYIDLSLNSSMEMSDLLVGIREKTEAIEGKIEAIESKIEGINLEGLSIPEAPDYTKDFELINQKLDSFNIETDAEIKESIKEIKGLVESQKGFIEQLDQLGKLSRLDNLESIKSDLQNSFKSFENKLAEAVENAAPDDSDHTKNVKQELKAFKSDLFENLVEFFNQISFVSEAEEIKDFIDESSREIKNSLKTLQKELGAKQSEEIEDEYSYTLQDVESDIAKVRIILKELAETKQEKPVQVQNLEGLDKLNENIMSISSRTNKLLLNSDETYNSLKENLDDFKTLIYQLEGTSNDSKHRINRLEEKIENINNIVLSGAKSDKIFNQTFMYLAEWVDNASENIGTVVEKMPEIDGIKMAIADLKQIVPRRSDVETILDEISTKFDKQQEKIDSLEEKMELLLSNSGLSEAKTDTKLNKKIDSIEKQLSKLTESIATIASYVEE